MEPSWALSKFPKFPLNDDQLQDEWSSLRPRAIKLINSVSAENMSDTAEQFTKLGFPWADSKLMVSLANLIVSACAGHGFYAECYAQLICILSKHCETAPLPTGSSSSTECPVHEEPGFLCAVKTGLSEQFGTILSGMSKDESISTASLPNKLRDRLVNCCKLAAGLFHYGVSSVDEVTHVLQCLGVLNFVHLQGAAIATSTQGSMAAQLAMPRVAMLSGSYPLSQPIHGETMADWRARLANELHFPSARLGLLDGECEVPCDARLEELEGMLHVVVRQVYIKEEYRVEAACTLLLKAMPDLLTHDNGQEVVRQVLAQWEPGVDAFDLLPKRAHFMIMDVECMFMDAKECSKRH